MDEVETLYADLQNAFAAVESFLSQADWLEVAKNRADKVSSGSGATRAFALSTGTSTRQTNIEENKHENLDR